MPVFYHAAAADSASRVKRLVAAINAHGWSPIGRKGASSESGELIRVMLVIGAGREGSR